ncbi:hypothetical protein [Zooshikella sp. RANM57]|uniref:hypothetical protein n=1 Tax=Zooshikella sp. RANM57 TaxID=3425863 RepID=UPI003D6F6E32
MNCFYRIVMLYFILGLTSSLAHAGVITAEAITTNGMHFVYGSASRFSDGDTRNQVYVNPYTDNAYIEFSFDALYISDFIRIYNDYAVNDDSLTKFSLAFFNAKTLVTFEEALTSPTSVSTHDIAYSKQVGPFNRIRLYPIESQLPHRFQVREIQFNTTKVPEPSSLLLLLSFLPLIFRQKQS